MVQARISSFWAAPPVDISGKVLTVTVRFRLERDGSIGGVTIEQTSGNAYFDMAAQRAVQSAVPLPRVPSELTDSYFDAHFTFAVGEAAG
ncbi:MAG: TonB C-terminal domain-containing protein [Nitrospira sp.]|nr:TonB C-terminal domain-containing protein [Nitrospira sp.]